MLGAESSAVALGAAVCGAVSAVLLSQLQHPWLPGCGNHCRRGFNTLPINGAISALILVRIIVVCDEEEHKDDCHTLTHKIGCPKCSFISILAKLSCKSVSSQTQLRKPHILIFHLKIFWSSIGTAQEKRTLSTSFMHIFVISKYHILSQAGQTSSSQNSTKSHVSHS